MWYKSCIPTIVTPCVRPVDPVRVGSDSESGSEGTARGPSQMVNRIRIVSIVTPCVRPGDPDLVGSDSESGKGVLKSRFVRDPGQNGNRIVSIFTL